MKKIIPLIVIVSITLSVLSGCGGSKQAEKPGLPIVYVGIQPSAFIVAKVAENVANVRAFLPESADPHTYEPVPSKMRGLQDASAFFTTGMEFEAKMMPAIAASNKNMKIFQLDSNIQKIKTGEEVFIDKNHGNAFNVNIFYDKHIWLSPVNIKTMAVNAANALLGIYPESRELIMKNLSSFIVEVDTADVKIKARLQPSYYKKVYINHPSLTYFALYYNLRQSALESEGKSASPKQLESFIKEAKADKIKAVFIEPGTSREAASVLAKSAGAKMIKIYPLNYDLLKNLDDISILVSKY